MVNKLLDDIRAAGVTIEPLGGNDGNFAKCQTLPAIVIRFGDCSTAPNSFMIPGVDLQYPLSKGSPDAQAANLCQLKLDADSKGANFYSAHALLTLMTFCFESAIYEIQLQNGFLGRHSSKMHTPVCLLN